MPRILKMSANKERISSALSKKETVTAAQLAFRTLFQAKPCSRVSIYA